MSVRKSSIYFLLFITHFCFCSIVSIGKYGSFPTNQILGRPYNLTFEILDKDEGKPQGKLRIVPAAELNAEVLEESSSTPAESSTPDRVIDRGDGVEYDVTGHGGEMSMRSNRETIDDSTRQTMSMDEIEALKKEGTGAGKDLVTKILLSHSALDQKTAYSLAKYTLRKTRKYLRRFTVLPLDVPTLANWIISEREPAKVLDLREEMLALIGSWANVHYSCDDEVVHSDEESENQGSGRWLVVDETGGLVVASLAEKMGVLYPYEEEEEEEQGENLNTDPISMIEQTNSDAESVEIIVVASENTVPPGHAIGAMLARSNSLTLIHANAQPNTSLLSYFLFDSSTPTSKHPLYRHLRTLSWLQLLSPSDDVGYAEPEFVSKEVLKTWKSGKRGTYFRKRRRWERTKSVVDETRAGAFDGLVVASAMNPTTILQHTVPLLHGAAQVVVYSPTIEALVELADHYSTARRAAFVAKRPDPSDLPNEDFRLDPTLLLAPTIHTARVKPWQVLPGRTHPLMTGRGGSEGYVFTATRVLPAEGKVEARGKFKRRKIDKETPGDQSAPDAS